MAKNTHFELQKTRRCAALIQAWILGDISLFEELKSAISKELGNGWSLMSALQFMSGKAAKAALDQSNPEDQVLLMITHQVAKEVCSKYGLSNVDALTEADQAEFRALVMSVKNRQ